MVSIQLSVSGDAFRLPFKGLQCDDKTLIDASFISQYIFSHCVTTLYFQGKVFVMIYNEFASKNWLKNV